MSALDTRARAGSLWRDAFPAEGPVAEDRPGRRPARGRPVVVDLLAAAAGIGLGITVGLEVTAETAGSLSAAGGIATALGRLTGLLAAYAMVVVVLLVARIPPLERAIGQDRLVSWHRRLAAALRGRRHLLPARSAADGLRDLVVGAPLHLPRAVPVVFTPDRHGRLVRGPSRRAFLVDGALAGNARRRHGRADRPDATPTASGTPTATSTTST